MIRVRVRLFASLRESAGWAEKPVELPAGATVETLLASLATLEDGLALQDRPVYAAINRTYVQRDAVLHDGDEVALFPPVSGGGCRTRSSREFYPRRGGGK